MTEQRIDINMLARIDSEQKTTASRVDAVDARLGNIESDIAEIEGVIKPKELPWAVRFFLFPLAVAALVATVAAVIHLEIAMNGIQTFIHDNGGFIAGLRLEKFTPSDPQSLKEVRQIITQAKAEKVKIPIDVIINSGKRFIEASDGNHEDWPTAQQYLDYRSFLNADFVPNVGQLTKSKDTKYRSYINTRLNPYAKLPADSFTVYFAGGYVPPEQSARLDNLDNPQSINPHSESSGIGLFVLEGKADGIVLDHMYMKNVIVRNSDVYYEGGKTRLENVYFVNCEFHFELDRKSVV